MRSRIPVVVWASFLLLALLVAQLGFVSIGRSDSDEPLIRIPAARYGDAVEVQEYWGLLDYGVDEGSPYREEYPLVDDGQTHYRVAPPLVGRDLAGNPRPAVLIAETRFLPPNPDDPCTYANPTRNYSLDLETRVTLTLTMLFADACAPGADAGRHARYEQTLFGPDLSGSHLWVEYRPAWISSVLQGHTFAVGEPIGALERERERRFGGNFSFRFDAPETYEGRPAWVLRGHAILDLSRPAVGVRATDWINETYVFEPDSPWPLYAELEWAGIWSSPGGWGYGREIDITTRQSLDRGLEAVPWGGLDLAWRPAIAPTEWSPGPVPGSGRGFPGAFPVEAAEASVAADPGLTGLSAWFSQNPGARLVGVRHTPTAAIALAPVWPFLGGASTWALTYAAPDGATAYRVNSTRYANGIIRNTEDERSRIVLPEDDRYSAAMLPPASPTFAHAARLWNALSSHGALGQPANYFVWGYGFLNDPYSVTKWNQRFSFRPEDALTKLYAGRIDAAALENPARRLTPADATYIVLDTEEGKPIRHAVVGWSSPLALVAASPPSSGFSQPLPAPRAPLEGIAPWAASASLLAILLLVYFYPASKFLAAQLQGLVPGYAKLQKHRLLENAFREKLERHIRAEPGITPPELQALIGGGWSTIVYHLRRLQRSGVVNSYLDGRHRRFFPADAIDASRRHAIGVLRNARTRTVLETVRESPGAHQRHVRKATGFSHGATQWHLERLVAAGLVQSTRSGRRTEYRASETPPPDGPSIAPT